MLLLMQMSSDIQRFAEFPGTLKQWPSALPASEGEVCKVRRCAAQDHQLQKIRSAAKVTHDNYVAKDSGYYLQAAIISGNLDAITYLLEEGHHPDGVYNDFTALTLCLTFHKHLSQTLDLAKLLIEYGANVNLFSPLHIACRKGLTPVIELLIVNGATPEAVDSKSGLTALQMTLKLLNASTVCSSQVGMYTAVALLLLRIHIDVTNCGVLGPSPLHLAVCTSQPAIILALIAKSNSRLSYRDVKQALELMESSFTGSENSRDDIVSALRRLNSDNIPSLQELSKNIVRRTMSRRLSAVRDLPCPTQIKKFILQDSLFSEHFCEVATDTADTAQICTQNRATPTIPRPDLRILAEQFLAMF